MPSNYDLLLSIILPMRKFYLRRYTFAFKFCLSNNFPNSPQNGGTGSLRDVCLMCEGTKLRSENRCCITLSHLFSRSNKTKVKTVAGIS